MTSCPDTKRKQAVNAYYANTYAYESKLPGNIINQKSDLTERAAGLEQIRRVWYVWVL